MLRSTEGTRSKRDGVGGPYEVALDHAIRWWNAEEENSRRHAARVQLLLTVGVAFVGVGLFRLGLGLLTTTAPQRLPGGWLHAAQTLLLAGLLILTASFFQVVTRLWSKKPEEGSFDAMRSGDVRPSSSFALPYESEVLESILELPRPEAGTSDFYRLEGFVQTSRAAEDLALRNLEERRRIDRAQRGFAGGLLVILVAIGVYTCAPAERDLERSPRRPGEEVSDTVHAEESAGAPHGKEEDRD